MSPVGLRIVLWPWPPSLLFHESLLLVCESTWKVLPLMSDVVPVLAASVWSSCKGFSFFRLLNIWRHWSITKGEESDGGQVVFRGRSIKNQPFAPTSSKSSCLIWFYFILKILGVQLLLDACSLYTFIQFSLCACLTLLRMIWPVMRLMFLMSKATNKSVFVLSPACFSFLFLFFWGKMSGVFCCCYVFRNTQYFKELSLKIE